MVILGSSTINDCSFVSEVEAAVEAEVEAAHSLYPRPSTSVRSRSFESFESLLRACLSLIHRGDYLSLYHPMSTMLHMVLWDYKLKYGILVVIHGYHTLPKKKVMIANGYILYFFLYGFYVVILNLSFET